MITLHKEPSQLSKQSPKTVKNQELKAFKFKEPSMRLHGTIFDLGALSDLQTVKSKPHQH